MPQTRVFSLVLKDKRLKVTTDVKIEVSSMLSPSEVNLLKRKLADLYLRAHTEMTYFQCYVGDIKTKGVQR